MGHGNSSDVEQIQREQLMLANDAPADKMTDAEFVISHENLIKRQRDLLQRLTGCVINTGYGLSASCQAMVIMNYAPPSCCCCVTWPPVTGTPAPTQFQLRGG